MKRVYVSLISMLILATAAFAGNVYGTITEGGKPVAQGLKIEITCGSNNHSAETDAYGAFKLFVADKGKCVLKLPYQGQTPTIDINSYEGSIQYDLILEKQGAQYVLKRK